MHEWLRLIGLNMKLKRIEEKHKAFRQSKKYKDLSKKDQESEDQSFYQIDYSEIWERRG